MAHVPDRQVAGFPPEAWKAFASAIDPSMMKKDQNGQTYVKHQVCTDALNRCFGQDGWTLQIINVWTCDPYTYYVSGGQGNPPVQKDGRYFAEAHVRLTIGRGDAAVFRENIGAQVAGGSRDEARKGAVSEALKRAASLFGWAPNVYLTDQLPEEWIDEAIMREKQREETAGFALPDRYETALIDWMTKLGFDDAARAKVMENVESKESAWAVAAALKHLVEKSAPEPAPKSKKGAQADASLPV